MGFRVVDRAWTGGWTTHEGGLKKESCRYATLLTWVHDHLHKGGKFVATGNSGGSAEIGYAMTTWQRGDILDLAIPLWTAHRPAGRRLRQGGVGANGRRCARALFRRARWTAHPRARSDPSNDVCKQVAAEPTLEQLHDDSVMHPGAMLDYPKTRVHFLFGAKVCGVPVPMGLTGQPR